MSLAKSLSRSGSPNLPIRTCGVYWCSISKLSLVSKCSTIRLDTIQEGKLSRR